MFTFRKIDTSTLLSCDDVKYAIETELQGDIISGELDLGIATSGNIMTIGSRADLLEFWN